jgi:diguanylate cyclase (GGDEF)-like protein
MIIKEYLQLVAKRWWLLALAFSVVFSGTYYWTSQQTPIYESHASFVIRPRSETVISGEFLKALDTVSNRSEINSTFAEVATSKLIKTQAAQKMGLTAKQQIDLDVESSVVAGTNILEIRVESRDPIISRDFADAIGAETVAYVKSLYDIYQLETLDTANTPSKPKSPDLTLNLSLGAFLGLALGVSIIFLNEAFKPSYKEMDTFNIIDRETGAYNKSYLTHRLFQEISRSKRTRAPLSIGLIRVNFNNEENLSELDRLEALRRIRVLTEKSIREEDILARFNGMVFAILFPDLRLDRAQESLDNVKQVIESVSHDMGDGRMSINSYLSAVSYTGGRQKINHEKLLKQAFDGLNQLGSNYSYDSAKPLSKENY